MKFTDLSDESRVDFLTLHIFELKTVSLKKVAMFDWNM